jgi:hypothetical protein
MTISHHAIPHPGDRPIIFAELGGFTCSICAPFGMGASEVAHFAQAQLGTPAGIWHAVDKSKMGLGSATPHACEHDSHRRHWFLLAGPAAVAAINAKDTIHGLWHGSTLCGFCIGLPPSDWPPTHRWADPNTDLAAITCQLCRDVARRHGPYRA